MTFLSKNNNPAEISRTQHAERIANRAIATGAAGSVATAGVVADTVIPAVPVADGVLSMVIFTAALFFASGTVATFKAYYDAMTRFKK